MKFSFGFRTALMAFGLWVSCAPSVRAAEEIDISKAVDANGWPKPVPVSISGFSGEVNSVLRNDLLFMGMVNVSPSEAQFLISGSNAGRVEGRVVTARTKTQILAKAYVGSTTRSQTHALADDICLAITGKRGIAQTKITFKVETGGGNGEVYIGDFDGFNAQPVTQDRAIVAAPCWAGRSALFYTSYKLGAPYIFAHQLTTGARHPVARYPGLNASPAASPDGKKLAMILSKGGSPDLYVSDLDGSNLKQLTATKEAESSPCWSPDNQTICYVSRDRGPASLYTVSAAGGAARRILTTGTPNPTEPDWSPDGKWIAFTSQVASGFNICIVKSQGGDAIVIAPGEDPTWAPNSRAVIFCKGPDHAKKLSLLDVPTKQVKDVARILESNSQPSWAK